VSATVGPILADMIEEPASRLVLVRHGESRSNQEHWISSQSTCGGLTDKGRAEAQAARDRLAQLPELAPDAVVVSTMRRAIETAAIVVEPIGMQAEQRSELIERVPGEVEGMLVDDFVDRFGHRPFSIWEPALSPGGEDAHTFQTRVSTALDRLTVESVGRTTWVVCHGWVIRAAAHHFVGGEPSAEPTFTGVVNASLCVWTSLEPEAPWMLERYNDHAHVPGLGAGTGSFV
jgi:probable phosphoglycerate mutase